MGDQHVGDHAGDGVDGASLADLRELVGKLLAKNAPERYDVNDYAWADPVFEEARAFALAHLDPREVVDSLVSREIRGSDGAASRRACDYLARIVEDGNRPMGWDDGTWVDFLTGSHLPLICGGVKVQLYAITPADLDQWVEIRKRKLEEDQRIADKECAGAQYLAQVMRAQGVNRPKDLDGRRLPPPPVVTPQ